MGGSSSSSATAADGKFIKIGEEFVGEDERTFSSASIYKLRFLKAKVIDRVIVQLRIEVKVGNSIWTVLRSLADFRQLKEALILPGDFALPFPKTDQRCFPDNEEIINIQKDVSQWLKAAVAVGTIQQPLLMFLGVLESETQKGLTTKIDLDTLIKTCETGDILLFKTNGLVPSYIRRITKSKYDHIGVVVAEDLDGGGTQKCFLEASGDDYGVHTHNLRKRLREWYLADAKVCYRRLRCVRDEKFKEKASCFVKQVNGIKYGYSIKSLVLFTHDSNPATKKKFFCSELVTAFYKYLGFIQSDARSYTYMPGDYSEKVVGARLNLMDAVLENEVSVAWLPKQQLRIPVSRHSRNRSISQQNCFRPTSTDSDIDDRKRERSFSTGSCHFSRNLHPRRDKRHTCTERVCWEDGENVFGALDNAGAGTRKF